MQRRKQPILNSDTWFQVVKALSKATVSEEISALPADIVADPVRRAIGYYLQRRHVRAVETYAQAIEIKPRRYYQRINYGLANVYFNEALVEIEKGNAEEACTFISYSILLDPLCKCSWYVFIAFRFLPPNQLRERRILPVPRDRFSKIRYYPSATRRILRKLYKSFPEFEESPPGVFCLLIKYSPRKELERRAKAFLSDHNIRPSPRIVSQFSDLLDEAIAEKISRYRRSSFSTQVVTLPQKLQEKELLEALYPSEERDKNVKETKNNSVQN